MKLLYCKKSSDILSEGNLLYLVTSMLDSGGGGGGGNHVVTSKPLFRIDISLNTFCQKLHFGYFVTNGKSLDAFQSLEIYFNLLIILLIRVMRLSLTGQHCL